MRMKTLQQPRNASPVTATKLGAFGIAEQGTADVLVSQPVDRMFPTQDGSEQSLVCRAGGVEAAVAPSPSPHRRRGTTHLGRRIQGRGVDFRQRREIVLIGLQADFRIAAKIADPFGQPKGR